MIYGDLIEINGPTDVNVFLSVAVSLWALSQLYSLLDHQVALQ